MIDKTDNGLEWRLHTKCLRWLWNHQTMKLFHMELLMIQEKLRHQKARTKTSSLLESVLAETEKLRENVLTWLLEVTENTSISLAAIAVRRKHDKNCPGLKKLLV